MHENVSFIMEEIMAGRLIHVSKEQIQKAFPMVMIMPVTDEETSTSIHLLYNSPAQYVYMLFFSQLFTSSYSSSSHFLIDDLLLTR